MSEDGRNKLREYGIAPPQAVGSRRALFGEQQVACPQCGSAEHRGAVRVRLDLLQGAVALQELPRTVRLFQVSLSHDRHCERSEAIQRRWIASSLRSSQ